MHYPLPKAVFSAENSCVARPRMEFFKLLAAPKTKDPEYEDARLVFKTMYLDPGRYETAVRSLVRSIQDLSGACLKIATAFDSWCEEAAADAGDIAIESRRVAQQATELSELTTRALMPKIQPNFLSRLDEYKQRVAEVHKLKEERNRLVKEFDKARERVRIAEEDKKPKQEKIEKAQAQCQEATAKYEAANREFIDNVNKLGQERIETFGGPVKSLFAILGQYLNEAGAGGDVTVRLLEAPKVSRPSPKVETQETTQQQVAEEPEPQGMFGQPVAYTYNEPQSGGIVADPGYQGDDLDDDGWNNSFNPVEQGYVQQGTHSGYGYQDDNDFGKNPFD